MDEKRNRKWSLGLFVLFVLIIVTAGRLPNEDLISFLGPVVMAVIACSIVLISEKVNEQVNGIFFVAWFVFLIVPVLFWLKVLNSLPLLVGWTNFFVPFIILLVDLSEKQKKAD